MSVLSLSFLKPKKLIVTHDGGFHPDDVFAAATLSLYYEKIDQSFIIRRSRDVEDIQKADVVFDVGMVYDHEKGRFDHHQKEGAGERQNGIPYAAFGLVWRHFGLDLVNGNKNVWQAVDDQLAAPIDGPDNGVRLEHLLFSGVKPFYLGDVLSLLFGKGKDPNKEFAEAVLFAKRILSEFIEKIQSSEESKQSILRAYEQSPDKRYVVIETPVTRQMVWFSLIDKKDALFAIFPGKSEDAWKLVGLKDDMSSFALRKDLPVSWGGLQDDSFQKETGVSDAIFCHRKLFLAEAKTKQGALSLLNIALG